MIDGKTASEIFDSIRQHVTTGALAPGETLPPVRELASELNVNRNTVAAAYKRLVTSGLALSQGRNGTVIKGAPSPLALEGSSPDTPLTDLSGGNPDPQRLPDLSSYFSTINKSPRLYGDAAVSPGLHAWAKQWMQDAIPGEGEIDITSGAIDAIERLLCAHLLPGDSVAVEDPCFLSSISMLRYAGFSAIPVGVDSEGMQPEMLEQALKNGARAVILTPRAHNPTGCSLSASRAAALQNIAAKYPQALVIIDDHFALLSSSPWHPVIAPETLHWSVVRSMSKTLGPDLRLAIVASDPATSARLRLRLNSGSQWVSHLLQDLVHACLSDKNYQRTLAQTRQFYASQQQKLACALQRTGLTHAPGDGLNAWLPLKSHSQGIAFMLAKAGWLVREGEAFGVNAPAHGLRITLSTLGDGDINKLAADIHQALKR
ncbi:MULTISPECIES: transcriptional regulator PtsJ [Citrobacter]|uniref:MocR-like B6 salvage transcription factor PtsJ n=1 Tax=Citrobacter TaxID=544 RepID=UPI000CE67135|nr:MULTISPECIES: transcriptional regulator PtsJ [Citrobacter]AVE58826.1 transcriptional regulator PtsJ [Citrobacter koseri]ELO4689911.1 transcriptional regulator PtsJ [Citrobacter koseri]EMD6812989.1 transcriptional regulator PtsJ [Citrobacter koseri]MBJ8868224.1 transcriptional regulator PtsJ [Citrobacter koseri]MBL4565535.1 transcriptional regulator PtsJ [Citrobacter koseri]